MCGGRLHRGDRPTLETWRLHSLSVSPCVSNCSGWTAKRSFSTPRQVSQHVHPPIHRARLRLNQPAVTYTCHLSTVWPACLVPDRAGVRWLRGGEFQRCPGVWQQEGDRRRQYTGKWSVGAQVIACAGGGVAVCVACQWLCVFIHVTTWPRWSRGRAQEAPSRIHMHAWDVLSHIPQCVSLWSVWRVCSFDYSTVWVDWCCLDFLMCSSPSVFHWFFWIHKPENPENFSSFFFILVLADYTTSLEMPRRKSLPVEMISRNNFSVWSILKKCIGMVSLLFFP